MNGHIKKATFSSQDTITKLQELHMNVKALESVPTRAPPQKQMPNPQLTL